MKNRSERAASAGALGRAMEFHSEGGLARETAPAASMASDEAGQLVACEAEPTVARVVGPLVS